MHTSLRSLALLFVPAIGVASPALAGSLVTSAPAAVAGQLATTGAEITGWIVAAVVFLGLGALLFVVSRRQRARSTVRTTAGDGAPAPGEATRPHVAADDPGADASDGGGPRGNPVD